jgi:hypothetical protein
MHSSAFFTMASNLPVMKLCVFNHELILRFTRFFLSLKQSLPLLDLCQVLIFASPYYHHRNLILFLLHFLAIVRLARSCLRFHHHRDCSIHHALIDIFGLVVELNAFLVLSCNILVLVFNS